MHVVPKHESLPPLSVIEEEIPTPVRPPSVQEKPEETLKAVKTPTLVSVKPAPYKPHDALDTLEEKETPEKPKASETVAPKTVLSDVVADPTPEITAVRKATADIPLEEPIIPSEIKTVTMPAEIKEESALPESEPKRPTHPKTDTKPKEAPKEPSVEAVEAPEPSEEKKESEKPEEEEVPPENVQFKGVALPVRSFIPSGYLLQDNQRNTPKKSIGVCMPTDEELYRSKNPFEILQQKQVHEHSPTCEAGCANKCTKDLIKQNDKFPKDFRITGGDSEVVIGPDEIGKCECVEIKPGELNSPKDIIKRILNSKTPTQIMVVKFSACVTPPAKPFKTVEVPVSALTDDGVFLKREGDVCKVPCEKWSTFPDCALKNYPDEKDGVDFAIVDIDL
eukprot:Platyproteum_vivax@DN7436_c0_g1_i5.p1